MTDSLYPLKLQPALHRKVWGGRKLADVMRKPLPSADPYGEAWEMHDSVTVANGPLRGGNLGDLAKRFGQALIGAGNDPGHGVPLLVKLIDAGAWLSVQVHPDDRQALELEGEPRGKTEAWLILAAEPGARLVRGLAPGTDRDELEAAIRQNQVEGLLAYIEVHAGDVLFMRANTVHALGPGLLIYEIQQASDTTYRLYDWGRMGLDGLPRELHIERGVAVASLDSLPAVAQPTGELLVECAYFQTWRHRLKGNPLRIESRGRFQCLTCIDGTVNLRVPGAPELELSLGESGFIPACLPIFELSGRGTILRSCQA